MKPMGWIGLFLVVVGILLFTYQGVIWVRGKETVAKVGPVEVEREKSVPIPIAPIVGGLTLAGGIVLLVAGRKGTA